MYCNGMTQMDHNDALFPDEWQSPVLYASILAPTSGRFLSEGSLRKAI